MQAVDFDALTGAFTRTVFNLKFQEEYERASRYNLALSLVLLDLDHFKSINDAFGHRRGDEVLAEFVHFVKTVTRTSDMIFRLGGDEFALLLPHTTRPEAVQLASRLVDKLQNEPFSGEPPITLTISVGVAAFPEDGQNFEQLFEIADQRTYAAKRYGRGRVVASSNQPIRLCKLVPPQRLLERDSAIEHWQSFLHQLAQQPRGLLQLSGDSGVGFSSFLAEIGKLAKLQGYATLAVEGSFAHKLRHFGAVGAAITAIPDFETVGLEPEVLLPALEEWLRAYKGLVITVDNPAWLDHSSQRFLASLFEDHQIPKLAIVWASSQLEYTGSGQFENERHETIELKPLSLQAIRVWLRHSLEWEAPQEVVKWLYKHSQGFPALLQTGLEWLVEQNKLLPTENGWQLARGWQNLDLAGLVARLRGAVLHNLSGNLPELVGREKELEQIRQLFLDSRLVTLLGLGGIGKTRLALQIAAESIGKYRHGVYFVTLAATAPVEAIISGAILEALGQPVAGEAKTQLISYLEDKELLLVLDNFEHLLEQTGLINALLERCPRLRLVVTSRERLELDSERVLKLSGLEYPVADETGGEYFSAVRLFTQSALSHQPEFEINALNRAALIRICRIVQGMPLGLNLAAAWAGVLSLEEIANQLEEQAADLLRHEVAAPDGNRTLQGVMDSFWSLLSPYEQTILARLAVFRGGFTREAAWAVAEASLFFLEGVVTRSWLERDENGRYELHELIRQYLEKKLEVNPTELANSHQRHATYFVELFEKFKAGSEKGEAESIARIMAESENLRVVWGWALQNNKLNVIHSLIWFIRLVYGHKSYMTEQEKILDQAIRAVQTATQEANQRKVLIDLMLKRAHTLSLIGRTEEALAVAQEALAQARQAGLVSSQLKALQQSGETCVFGGNFPAALGYFNQLLKFDRSLFEPFHWLRLLFMVGISYDYLGDYQNARKSFNQMESDLAGSGDLAGQALLMSGYAQLETETGNWSEGQRCTEQALQLNLATGNDYNYYFIFWLKGVLARQVGNYSEAEEHHRFAIMHSQKFNSPVMVAINQMHLAVVCQLMGELQRAEDYSRSAMAITQQIGQRFLQVATAIRLGYILLESGQFTEAEEVLTKVLALQRECGRQDYILETLAGLVEVWLAQQKWEPIKANILELSSGLMREVPTAIGEPFRPYLVGYRALVKLEQRQLASELINFAHFQLLESATKIKEDTLRQAFLNKVAVHAQILAVASRAGSGSDKHLCQI